MKLANIKKPTRKTYIKGKKRKKTNDLYKQKNKIFPRPTDLILLIV